ncbi:hypothetical protein NXX09_19345 [Bacteroides uniformis]|nr:hypothetical protein [Bacteroides uniformis]
MATTFEKLISLVAYDNALTERTDDFYLRAKTQPRTPGHHRDSPRNSPAIGQVRRKPVGITPHGPTPIRVRTPHPERPYLYETLKKTPNE